MGYSEELDLIQNVKNLSGEISDMMKSFSEIEPSMNQILEMRDQFTDLHDSTVAVIEKYQDTLDSKNGEIDEMLENCRSQFKQVTDDVESLVNLQVNFTEIKSDIELCIELSDTIADMLSGCIVLMTSDSIVPASKRVSYKRYLEVTDSIKIDGTFSSTYVVGPNMAISFDEP